MSTSRLTNFILRNNWRPYLTEVVDRILSDHLDVSDTNLEIEDLVRTINENMWVRSYLGNDVVFKSSQTPLIYDPMSTIVFGFASCTGEKQPEFEAIMKQEKNIQVCQFCLRMLLKVLAFQPE